jgi:hypothetical protein
LAGAAAGALLAAGVLDVERLEEDSDFPSPPLFLGEDE